MIIRREYIGELTGNIEHIEREIKRLAFQKRVLEEERNRCAGQMLEDAWPKKAEKSRKKR